ncbi:IS66 family insertion sequence element accessory protein TnpA [Luteolibacter sp. AS25]|uniref:IS66 family insertion sequence element accessory protein TnpA n=1 Tax=Luteolibacter sp. AS25 TaxID=3135776 RepID=UPI00398B23E5
MASTQETFTSIIKSDRAGRTRYSKAYKDEVVAAYHQSNMSAAAFAQHCGVKYPTFASWVAKARQYSASSDGKADEGIGQRFILAEIGGSLADAPLKVELPGGVIVHVSSSDQLGLLTDLLNAIR